MLVSLSISYWTAKANDDRVVDEISTRHKANREQSEYRKILVDPEAINEVKAVRSRARAFYFDKTLPWIDGGTRILPSAYFFDFEKKMHEFKGEYEEATKKFIRRYTALKGEARKRLGSLFREEDYPSAAALESKFSWDQNIFPIPAKDDWRVTLGGDAEAKVKKQIDDQLKAAMQVATRDLFKRLHTVVSDLAETMKDAKKTFRDSIVGNIKELCGVLREMNIANDPELEKMIKAVEASLTKLNPDELREDKKKRKAAADSADEILKKMAGYLGK